MPFRFFEKEVLQKIRDLLFTTKKKQTNKAKTTTRKNKTEKKITYQQERIKGTEKASSIHTLFHR